MRGPFTSRRDGSIEVRMIEVEALAIRGVASEVLASMEDPNKPELRRLFPPAYADDAAKQEEFAGLTRDDLLAHKAAIARAVIASIDAGRARRGVFTGLLDADAARAWLSLVNDARLVLGTRLGVTEEMDHAPRPPEDPQGAAFNLYLYLGGIQELLVEHMLEHDVPDGGTD